MKKSDRLVKALCVVISASFMLCSCGVIIINRPSDTSPDIGTEDSTPGTTVCIPDTSAGKDYEKYVAPDYESVAVSELYSLPNADMGSQSVFITSAVETGTFFDESGEKVSASVYRRNRAVEDKYGLLLLSVVDSKDVIRESMQAAKKSKDLYTDIAVIPQSSVGEFNTAKLLGNIRMLPYFNDSLVGIDKDATSQLSFGDKLYGVCGNATKTPEKVNVVFLNETLASKLGIDIKKLHSDVLNGDFILETLSEMAKQSAVSVDSESLPDVLTSLYFSECGSYTSGDKTLSQAPSSNSIVTGIRELFGSFDLSSFGENDEESGGFESFAKGEALFAIARLDMIEKLGGCGFSWDILPLPKANDEQAYYIASMSYDAPVMTVSTFTFNIDAMGYALNGINAASFGFIAQEYGKYLENGFITSSRALDSFDLICSLSVKYDTSVMFRSVSNINSASESALLSSVKSGSNFVNESNKYRSKFNSSLKALR